MSRVMCHISRVTCHMYFIFILFFGQSGEAYRWRVCYQRGLPRLVSVDGGFHLEFDYISIQDNHHYSKACTDGYG